MLLTGAPSPMFNVTFYAFPLTPSFFNHFFVQILWQPFVSALSTHGSFDGSAFFFTCGSNVITVNACTTRVWRNDWLIVILDSYLFASCTDFGWSLTINFHSCCSRGEWWWAYPNTQFGSSLAQTGLRQSVWSIQSLLTTDLGLKAGSIVGLMKWTP